MYVYEKIVIMYCIKDSDGEIIFRTYDVNRAISIAAEHNSKCSYGLGNSYSVSDENDN